MFTKDSYLVKLYVSAINDENDPMTLEKVPNVSNLIEVVTSIINPTPKG